MGHPTFLCTFYQSAFIVEKTVFKAGWFGLPGNDWRTDNQTDGCVSCAEGYRQRAVCPTRERLLILKQRDFD